MGIVASCLYLSSSVGHGRSEGERVHVETFDTYVQDVIQHVERMKQEHPDVPCLLMGHSMVSTHCHVCTQWRMLYVATYPSPSDLSASLSSDISNSYHGYY